MSTVIKVVGLGTLKVDRDYIDVSSMKPTYVLDLDWLFTDAAGHAHTYASDGTLPTIVHKHAEYYCDDCLDYHVETYKVCKLCGEEVVPGVKFGAHPGSRRMIGREEFLINGQPVTREEADAFIARAKEMYP